MIRPNLAPSIVVLLAAACGHGAGPDQPDAAGTDAGTIGNPRSDGDAGTPHPSVGLRGPAQAYSGDTVQFEAVVPVDLAVDSYLFSFGDSTGVLEQRSSTASHVYRSAGTFTVLLTVRTSGSYSSAGTTIAVTTVPIDVVFSAPDAALVGSPIAFDASASRGIGAPIVSYTFDFGDGSQLEQQAAIATHAYTRQGEFRGTVTVKDATGAAVTRAANVVVGMQLSAPVALQHSFSLAAGQHIAAEASGAIDVVWETPGSAPLALTRSIDEGATFAPPATVGEGFLLGDPLLVTTGPGPAMHLVARAFNPVLGAVEIAYLKSVGGDAFSQPLSISVVDGVTSTAPAVATDGDRRLYAVWWDSGIADAGVGIWFTRSVDEGASFVPPIQLASRAQITDPNLRCPGVAHGKREDVLVVWLSGPDFQEQIHLARSVDGGGSFTGPVQPFSRPDHIFCPQLFGDSAGRLSLIWDEGTFIDPRTFISRSADSGASWTVPAALLPGETDVACVLATQRDDGQLALAYSTKGNSGDPPDPAAPYSTFVKLSSDAGATFGPPLRVKAMTGRSQCPVLAMPRAGRIALVWNAIAEDGNFDLLFSAGPVSLP